MGLPDIEITLGELLTPPVATAPVNLSIGTPTEGDLEPGADRGTDPARGV